jgi:flagellar biosynthesis protein FlhB
MAEDSEDRTEQASAHRLQKAREEGNIPLSRELPILAGLGGGTAVLAMQLATAGQGPVNWFAAMLHRSTLSGDPPWAAAATDILFAVVPCALGGTACVLSVGFLQTGFLLRIGALQPDFSRISPLKGLKRLLGTELLIQAAKATAKLAVFSWALWTALKRLLPDLAAAAHWQVGGLRTRFASEAVSLLLLLISTQVAITAADIFWVRLQHASRLRMSRQELKDEHKEAEGNPHTRARMRQIARSRARRRMMAAIRTAAVVVTNPDHYAVALAYERGSRAAPKLVAKGMDDVAARIREEARTHHIPMVANPPLARALYRVELDTEIPMEHFKAVAEVVAYVWRLRARPKR